MEQMNDSSRVLTLLGEIKAVVKGQSELLTEARQDTKDILDRVARLEESTHRAVPKVDDLDYTVQDHEHRIVALEGFKDTHCIEHSGAKTTAGNRLWDMAKAFLGPLAAVVVTWLVATKGGGK